MGMFDTLVVKCIFCGKDVEEQTKSGDCLMRYYNFEDADLPVWAMYDFNGLEWECYHCQRKFRTIFDVEVNIKVNEHKIETVDNLDYLELKDKEKNG